MDNYGPFPCLPLMWMLMTRIIANTVYVYMNTGMYNLPPIEQRRSRRNSRGAKDKLLADKMVLNDCKKKQTNLGVA